MMELPERILAIDPELWKAQDDFKQATESYDHLKWSMTTSLEADSDSEGAQSTCTPF